MLRVGFILSISVLLVVSGSPDGQESEFIKLVENLLQGDQLKTFQQTYAALPIEVRDKLTKDLLMNPGKFGKELVNMLGPHFQGLMEGIRSFTSQNEVEVDEMSNEYTKDWDGKVKKKTTATSSGGGFDFGPMAGMLGNLVSSNPQMLISMAQGLLNGNQNGFNLESITKMVTDQFDIDTMISMAQSFGLGGGGGSKNKRGDDDGTKTGGGGMMDMLKINEMLTAWKSFMDSPVGKRSTKIIPQVLKSQTLPDALRILEKETNFRFDIVLRQLQEPVFRQMFVNEMVKPIGRFLKSITIPADLKEVMAKSDEILNKKLGLGVKVKEYIEPVFTYIRDTFKITRDSLLDLSSEDIEKIASDLLNNEVLQPLSSVWEAHQKSKHNAHCANFIYCQLNKNFYEENFIRRNVIKTSSIISAFQVSSHMKKDAFSKLYENCYRGADGYDCTMGVNSQCLDLMKTSAHTEF